MTEKELRKLKRSDFLQLLITQGKDMSAVQTRLDETTQELEQLQTTNADLKAKVDEKDELIEKLVGRLDDKETTISALQQEIGDIKENRRIELEQAGSIAMAALSLNGIFETAQKAADQYLYNIQLMCDGQEPKGREEEAKPEHLEEAPQTAEPAKPELSEEAPQMEPEKPEPSEEAPQTAEPESQPEPATQPEPAIQPEPELQPEPPAAEPEPAPQEALDSDPINEAGDPTPDPETEDPMPPTKTLGLFEKLRLLGAQ